MRQERCECGRMAEVDMWNAKGILLRCAECGLVEMDRDRAYREALMARSAWLLFQKERDGFYRDSEDPELDDEYREICRQIADDMNETIAGARQMSIDWLRKELESYEA